LLPCVPWISVGKLVETRAQRLRRLECEDQSSAEQIRALGQQISSLAQELDADDVAVGPQQTFSAPLSLPLDLNRDSQTQARAAEYPPALLTQITRSAVSSAFPAAAASHQSVSGLSEALPLASSAEQSAVSSAVLTAVPTVALPLDFPAAAPVLSPVEPVSRSEWFPGSWSEPLPSPLEWQANPIFGLDSSSAVSTTPFYQGVVTSAAHQSIGGVLGSPSDIQSAETGLSSSSIASARSVESSPDYMTPLLQSTPSQGGTQQGSPVKAESPASRYRAQLAATLSASLSLARARLQRSEIRKQRSPLQQAVGAASLPVSGGSSTAVSSAVLTAPIGIAPFLSPPQQQAGGEFWPVNSCASTAVSTAVPIAASRAEVLPLSPGNPFAEPATGTTGFARASEQLSSPASTASCTSVPAVQYLPQPSYLPSPALPAIIPGLSISELSAFEFGQDMSGLEKFKRDDEPKWGGERGTTWLNHQQRWQGRLAAVRAQAMGKSVMCSLTLQQEFVLQGMKRDSIGERDALGVWEDLEAYVKVADKGWFPPAIFPAAAVDRVKRRQPAGVPVERILQNALKRYIQPILDIAAAEGCQLQDQNELDFALANRTLSPAMYQLLPTGQAVAPGFAHLKFKGRSCSPDMVVMEMFWILMHTMYAVSPQAEQDFYALAQAGSQGEMDVRAFAAEVERRFKCVEFVGGVVQEEVATIMVQGLNQPASREFGRSRLQKNRQLAIDDLVQMLEEYERVDQVEDLVTAKAARYGFVTGGSSSKTPKQSKAGTSSSPQSAITEMTKAAEKVRKDRGGYLRQLQKDNLPEYETIDNALKLLLTHSSHPRSLCLSCSSKGPLHTKAECKQDKKAPVGFAAAGQGAGQQQKQPAGDGGAAMSAQPGMFRAIPKPQQSAKGSKSFGYGGMPGQQRDQATPPAGAPAAGPCPVCNFPTGHPNGVCFYSNPKMAHANWGGPNRRADAQLVLQYLEACAQQQVTPRLNNCGSTVEQLLNANCLTPQAASMVLQQRRFPALPPATPHTAFMPPQQHRLMLSQPQGYQPHHMVAEQQLPMGYAGGPYPMDVSSSSQVWQLQGLQQALPPATPSAASAAMCAAQLYGVPPTPATAMGAAVYTPFGVPKMQGTHPPATAPPGPGSSQQQFLANVAQGQQQQSGPSSAAAGPRGFGWCSTVVREADDLGCGALVATRATTKQSSEGSRRQPAPKSFVAVIPTLPRDPNSSRKAAGSSTTNLTETASVTTDGVTAEQAWRALQDAMERHNLSLQQLTQQLSVLQSFLPKSSTAAAAVEFDNPISLMAAVLQGVKSGGFVQAFQLDKKAVQAEAFCSTAAGVSSVGQAMVSTATCDSYQHKGCGDVKALFPQELLFTPPSMAYVLQQQQRQGLDRFCSYSKREGITLVLPDGREILLEGVFQDSGANLLLVTEAFCKEIALFFRQGVGVPGVRGWKGFKERILLGYTDPFKLVLAKGTSYETTLHVQTAYVVPGDAGGMYTLCLDKQTVYAVYGHVNPLLQHFVWYPWIEQGDRVHLAGLPVQNIMSLPSDDAANTAFAAATNQLQEIHSLTGLELTEEAADLQLEPVAEATLDAIIVMERWQRAAEQPQRVWTRFVDDWLGVPPGLHVRVEQTVHFLGQELRLQPTIPRPLLLPPPHAVLALPPPRPPGSRQTTAARFSSAAVLSFRALAGYFCLGCLFLSMLLSGARAMLPAAQLPSPSL